MFNKIDCITDYKRYKKDIQFELINNGNIIYKDSIDKFKITKQKDGNYPAIITISGYSSEDNDNQSEWNKSILLLYPDREWFHLEWDSKKSLIHKVKSSNKPLSEDKDYFEEEASEELTKFEKFRQKYFFFSRNNSRIGDYLNPNNSWKLAVRNSRHTGVCLSRVLNACDRKEFIMIGHSLGSRVIYNCMRYTTDENLHNNILEIHMLGGAVCGEENVWNKISEYVNNGVFNYFSKHDRVLKYFFRLGMFSIRKPIGLKEIEGSAIINCDVNEYVKGHSEYIDIFYKLKNYSSTKSSI